MKKAHILCLLGMFLLLSNVAAQSIPADLINAFNEGSAQKIAPFLGENIELVVQNRKKEVSKSTAIQELSTFFAQKKVTGFTINHEGKRNDSSYIIGTLTTSGGDYRVNCYFKKGDKEYLIHQIRIDKTNE
ncbi:DUF4783 domain-containing protein [Bacteroides sp. 214]|uniref:DUF4783 domain-containing protein n=1 Tax=Bacteroides sp. 214 TaxID=2302935 RepID=UPI0013D3ABCA|nr:DUF4783 domain-containing protein [Bacteroides sp. 214]NDW13743.1 DUF4783 domain-containing protein [Bacteroides sp. 214]